MVFKCKVFFINEPIRKVQNFKNLCRSTLICTKWSNLKSYQGDAMFNFILKRLHITMSYAGGEQPTNYLAIDKQQQIIHTIMVALAHLENEPKINRMWTRCFGFGRLTTVFRNLRRCFWWWPGGVDWCLCEWVMGDFCSKCCYYNESWLECDITFCTFCEYCLIVGRFAEMDLWLKGVI